MEKLPPTQLPPITEFRRILVGVSLTLGGERLTLGCLRAVEQAFELARLGAAELIFLHSTWADLHEEKHALRPGPSAAGLQALEQLVERATAASIKARLAMVRDRPWLEIIQAVKRGEAELVFVARHNQEGAGSALGGITRKLMRKCPCPVWVVRPEGRPLPARIVAATDLTQVGDRAVELGAALAATFGAKLLVVHAWPLPMATPVLPELAMPAQSREDVEQYERTAREAFEKSLGALKLSVEPERHLLCSAPSVAIRETVEGNDADLLVMGTVSRSGIAGLLMGNTAERLLGRVQCSLLTIKPRDFVSPV